VSLVSHIEYLLFLLPTHFFINEFFMHHGQSRDLFLVSRSFEAKSGAEMHVT
jgi:hypothetical protein